MAVNPLRMDPSRTFTLRNRFQSVFVSKWRNLTKNINEIVVDQDVFGLKPRKKLFANIESRDFEFLTDPDKVTAFNNWLQAQIDAGLLELKGDPTKHWTDRYVESAYKAGRIRGFTDVKGAASKTNKGKAAFYQGTKQEFLRSAFSAQETVRKLQLLYTRAFDQLEGITSDMSGQMSRVLVDGLAHGRSINEIAKNLVAQVDGMSLTRAKRLARTEIINAHAEGQLDSFEDLGVEEVGLLAEWLTSGAPCPQCAAMAGEIFTIEEARGLIPLHPNCVCAWGPVLASSL